MLNKTSTPTNSSKNILTRLLLAAAILLGLAMQYSASAAIALVDNGPSTTVPANQTTTTINYTVSAGANCLVVTVNWRTPNGAPTVTYNGTAMTVAAQQLGTAATFINSGIYYMFSPPTGQSLPIVVNVGTTNGTISDGVICPFTLAGVDTSQQPNLIAGSNAMVDNEASVTNLSLTLSNIAPGSAAIFTTDWRQGTVAVLTASITAGSGTLITSGTGGGQGNLTYVNPGNSLDATALVLPVTSTTLTVNETNGNAAGTHWTMAAAAFAPLNVVTGPPTFASVTPNSGPNGGGTTLSIAGTNFAAGVTVKFTMPSGGTTTVNAGNVLNLGGTVLNCTLPVANPNNYAGTADITITNPNGDTVTAQGAFTYSSQVSAIALVDSFAVQSAAPGTAGPFTQSLTLSAACNTLVVPISSRSNAAAGSVLYPTVTFGGTPMIMARDQPGTATTLVDSTIFYLYNPPKGSAQTLSVNFNNNASTVTDYAWRAFTLSGVDPTSTPIVNGFTAENSPITISTTLTTTVPNSWQVTNYTYRNGTVGGTMTNTASAGTLTNSVAVGNFWVVATGNCSDGSALVQNVPAGTNTLSISGAAAAGTHFTLAAAAFMPLPPSTWSGAVDTTWSNSANWDFAPKSSTFEVLNFPGGAQITSNDDLGVATFQLTQLNHNNSFAGTNTISANPGNSIQFVGSNASLNPSGSAALNISAPLNLSVNTSFNVTGGPFTLSGPLSGSGVVTITGGSTTIFNNTSGTGSTNSGAITSSPTGTMQVDSGIGTANVVVSAGGTLTGTGSIAGTVNASGATISPGDSTGDTKTLAMGALTLSSTSQMNFDLNDTPAGANNDKIAINGTFNCNGIVNLNLGAGFTSQAGPFPKTYTLVTSTGGFAGTSVLPSSGLITTGYHVVSFDPDQVTGNNLTVTIDVGTLSPVITTLNALSKGTNGGNALTINGSNFNAASTVTIGGVNAPVTSENSGQIVVKTPATPFNGSLTQPVQVNNAGTLSNIVNYTYTLAPPPAITTVSPNYGKPTGGNTIVITGSAFFPNALVKPGITIQGTPVPLANETVTSATTITLTTPAGTAGAGDIVITNPDGQVSTTGAGAFTYSNPTLASVSPATGSSAGGTSVTINGNFFLVLSGATVKFGTGTALAVTVVNRNTITCTTPPAAGANVGVVDVLVTNADGSQGTLAGGFTYVQPVTYSPFNVNTVGTGTGIATTNLTYFNVSQLVTITTPVDPSATIFYTTDGTAPAFAAATGLPTGTTQIYTQPFTITNTASNTTVRAMAALGTPTLQAGPILNTVYAPYLPAAATPVQLTTGSLNYIFNAVTALPPYQTTGATTASGIVTAVSPDVLTDGTQDRTAAFAAGTTQPLPGLIGEGTLLNGRTLAAGNSNGSNNLAAGAFQGRFTGIVSIPTTGVYTFVTGSDDGSLLYIDPTSLTAPDGAHLVVANSVGQGVTQRFGQIGLLAGQHTIVMDYANTGGGFAFGAFWDPNGGTTTFVNIPNANLGVQAQLVATLSPTLATFGGTSNTVTLTQIVAISGAAAAGASIFYTTDGTTPAFDANFNPTGTTLIYTTPFNVSATPPVGGTVTVKAIAAGAGYISSALLTQTYTNVAPTVSSVLPAVGSPASNGAQTVTINGANFSRPGVTSVQFGAGLLATNVVVNSNTVLTCTLPNFVGAVPAPVNVIVTNNDAQTGTLANGFTFTGPPTITSLSVGAPNSPANSGTSLGGENFTLTGTNFAAGATVQFGTRLATNINVINSTTVTGVTPASNIPIASGGPGGPVALTYTGQDLRSVSQSTFTPNVSGFNYVAAPIPAITAISPTVGPFGGGTAIAITGTNFGAGATVKIGGNAATNVVVNSNISITATTPAGTTGIKDVTVTNVDSQVGTLVGGFTYLGAATGTAIAISFNGNDNNLALTAANGGIVNGTSTAPLGAAELVGVVARGNWNTTPSGTNGSLNTGTMSGLVDSTGAASGVTVTWASNENWVDTEGNYTGTYLAATPSNGNVRMMRCYLNRTDNTVNGVSVRLTGIPAGFGPFDVYVYGDGANGLTATNNAIQREGNYTLYSSVPGITQHLIDAVNSNFANNPVFVQCLPTTNPPNVGNYLLYSNVNAFTGTLPAGSTGTAVTAGIELDVTATSADGSARAPVSGVEIVSYNGLQFVGVTPAFGSINGGTTIKLKGTAFSNAVTANLAVSIGGIAATNVTFVDANTITAVTGVGVIPGPASVTLTNGDAAATQATVANGFAYLGPPPTLDPVTPITPNQGITSGGTAVTIIGTNFVTGATVTIGGFPATSVVVVSSTQITAVTGVSTKSGPSDVVVQNAGDSNIATAAGAFTYLAPAITSIAPTSGVSSGNYNAVITGTNFGTSTKVNFGTAAATNVVINSNTQITCLVPGSANGIVGAVDVVVTDGANSFGTLTGGFTYTAIPADNPAATVAGVEAKFYINGGNKVPGNAPTAVQTAFDSLPIVKGLRVDPAVTASIMTGPIADPGAPNSANVGTLPALVQDTLGVAATNFFMKVNGYINITTGGGYTFSMASDDGSLLFISGNLVIDSNPTGGQAVTPKTGTVNLQAGKHAFTILYGQGTGDYGFSLKYSGPDNGNVLGFVPDSVLLMDAGSPTLTSINPTTGAVGGNTVVTATGTGFAPGATVSVNGVFASQVVVNSNTSITFTTPGSATNANGAVNVVVANPTGLAVTLRPFTYDSTQYRIADAPTNPVPGVLIRYYDLALGDPSCTTNGILSAPFDPVPYRIAARSTAATYCVTVVPGTPPTFTENVIAYPTVNGVNFAAQLSGYLTVPSDGTYTFYTASDDGSMFFLGGTQIVTNNFSQGVTTRSGAAGIKLKAGMHPFTLQYAEGGGGFASYLGWSSPDSTPVLPADPGAAPGANHAGKPVDPSGNPILIPDSAFSFVPPTWIGAGASNWSVATNWNTNAGLGAFSPAQLATGLDTNESLVLRFAANGSNPFNANNDLNTPAQATDIYVMEFSSNVAGNQITGNPLEFAGTSYPYNGNANPAISQTGTGSVTINNNINVGNNLSLTSGTGGTGVVTLAGAITGANSITTFNANSVFVISGTNNALFGGAINVTGGVLGVNGSISGTPTTVGTSGVLRGTGTVNGSVASPGGTVFPGDAASTLTSQPLGTLSMGSLDLFGAGGNGGTLKVRVKSTGPGPIANISSDKLVISGSLQVDPAPGTGSTLEVHLQAPNAANYSKQDTLILDLGFNVNGSAAFGNLVVKTAATAGLEILYVDSTQLTWQAGSTADTDPSVVGVQTSASGPPTIFNPYNQIYVRLNGSVTPVTLDSFSAKADGAGVTLEWKLFSELQNAGFNVYRREVERSSRSVLVAGTEQELRSTWTKVNAAMIAGRITNPSAHTYRFYDWPAAGAYEYRLETVDSIGGHGSFDPHTTQAVVVDGRGSALVSRDGLDAVLSGIAAESMLKHGAELSGKLNAAANEAANPATGEPATNEGRLESRASTAPARVALDGTRVALDGNGAPLNSATIRDLSASAPREAYASARAETPAAASARSSALSAPGVLPRSIARPSAGGIRSVAKVQYSGSGVMLVPNSMLPAGFNANHTTVQREGVPVAPLAVTPNGLLLYGPGYSDDYTAADVFFLSNSSGATQAGAPSTAQGLFADNVAAKNNSAATANVAFNDVYFDWSLRPYDYPPYFSSQYLTQGSTQSFSITAANALAQAGSLTVNAWSLTSENAAPDHALQAFVNGVPAGQSVWTGGGRFVAIQFQIPAGVLAAGANRVDLVTPVLDGVATQIALLHSMSLSYTQSLSGPMSTQIVNSGAAAQVFEVSGLTGPAWVVDARYPQRAALAPTETQTQADGSQTLRFNALAGGTGVYLVVPVGSELTPLSVTKRTLKPAPGGILYLATGPLQFSAPAQTLAAARSKEGLKGAFVDQEQLFDYYNYGRYGPDGIRNAVRSIRPQYLLLMGRTSYDYLNYSGQNVDPLCPSYLTSTTFWAQTTSDAMFGDLGHGYAEVRVGRIPANDAGEASVAVSRILAHQGFAASGWTALMTADQYDPDAGDFAANGDSLIAANPAIAWKRNYLGVTTQSLSDVTAALTQAANDGTGLLLYEGHGNAAHLGAANRNILDTDSVQAWTGNTVVLASTCTFNWVANDVPNYHSIPIQALTQPQGGIAASIASTTYVSAAPGVAFSSQLLQSSQNLGANARWGDALMRAQQWAYQMSGGADGSWYLDLSKTESILGDPAMPVMSKPAAPASKPAVAPSTTSPGQF